MVLFLVVALASMTTAEPVKLAATPFQAVGIDAAKAGFFSDYLSQQLNSPQLRVTTQSELAAVIGLERQKQLLNCDQQSGECLSELAGALGVDGLITGSVARTESGSYAVAIKIISAKDARPLSVAAARLKSEDAVLDFFSDQAHRMSTDVLRALRPDAIVQQPEPSKEQPPTAPVEVASAGGSGSKAWVPFAVGGAFLAGGATLYVLANSKAQQVRNADVPNDGAATSALTQGRQQESMAFALLGAGLGTVGSGGVLLAAGDHARDQAWVPMAAGGGLAVAGGVFYALAKGTEASIRRGDPTQAELDGALGRGHAKENVAFGLAGAGLGAIATGGLTLAFGQPSQTKIAVSQSGGRSTLMISGEF